MARSATSADLIMEAIVRHPGFGLDELAAVCPTLTWDQIFLEVDRLSRDGRLRLLLIGPGRYVVEVPAGTVSRVRSSQEGPVPLSAPEWHPQDTRCERCRGLMVSERDDEFMGWRCILCGERTDPMILAQRHRTHPDDLLTSPPCR